eukprot:COSAG06_NODE_2681_length_6459_cov_3.199528_7_plen_86_part_01
MPFVCYVALAAPEPSSTAAIAEIGAEVQKFLGEEIAALIPATRFMRLFVEPNGQCDDIDDLPAPRLPTPCGATPADPLWRHACRPL